MAEDAECLFPLCSQVECIVSAHGVMTGGTGHHLPGMGIEDFRADGMGEFPLTLVTADTDIIGIAAGHGEVVTAVGHVTEAAFF